MLNELYTFAEPVQVVPFSSLKWGKFTLLHTLCRIENLFQLRFFHLTSYDTVSHGLNFSSKIVIFTKNMRYSAKIASNTSILAEYRPIKNTACAIKHSSPMQSRPSVALE